MTAAELIAEVAKLPADELVEFERMWTLNLTPEDVSRRLGVLRAEIQRGEDDFAAGRFIEMGAHTFEQLRAEAKRELDIRRRAGAAG
jgi:hypothetical protein